MLYKNKNVYYFIIVYYILSIIQRIIITYGSYINAEKWSLYDPGFKLHRNIESTMMDGPQFQNIISFGSQKRANKIIKIT